MSHDDIVEQMNAHPPAGLRMLDASMAHAVLAIEGPRLRLSSIDVNVGFLRPTRAGRFAAVGAIVKARRTVALRKAELLIDKGELVATATSSAHPTRQHR